jgi:DNA (cytosine-5)-methyltransferase 1
MYDPDTMDRNLAIGDAGEALSDFDLDEFIEEDGDYENAVGGRYGYLLKDIPPGANYQHFSERRYDTEEGEYVMRDNGDMNEKVFDWSSRHWNYHLKQDPDRPTWTLQADPGTYVGPLHWRSRPYSQLEQMRLMDIPTDYYVDGSPREVQRQIGNAVPPGVIETLATHLLEQTEADLPSTDSPATTAPDGGRSDAPDYRESFKITNGASPWLHAAEVGRELDDGNFVEVWAQGSKISNVLDVAELVRRQLSNQPEITLEAGTTEADESKSDILSTLHLTFSPS